MKNEKTFLFIIATYFALSGIFHFLRLAFDWKIILVGGQKDYPVATLISAICILFAVFIIYWICKRKREDNKKIKINIEEDGESVVE